MLVPMTQLEILGQRNVLDAALAVLQPLRGAEVAVRRSVDDQTAEAAPAEVSPEVSP